MDECRSCRHELPAPFLSLGSHPLSNAFLRETDLSQMEPTFPLDLHLCPECYLSQIDEFESAAAIFSEDYAYFSSFSQSWLDHCEAFVAMSYERFGLDGDAFVMELASNDGCLLRFFAERGVPLLGVEPARCVAEAAIAAGIDTDIEFFGVAYAEAFRANGRLADLVIANNVLAHNPNINDFVGGIPLVLAPTGVVTMEFPHLLRLIEGNQFDTIYHEHFSYLSFHALERLIARHALELFDVEELPTHGGSLRIYGQLVGTGVHPVSERVEDLRELERVQGLLDLETYERFAEQVAETKRKILTFLIEAKRMGQRIVGYGAPAKGNTLLNYCGVGRDFIDYTVDRSPHKQGRFLPGTRIPIRAPEVIEEDKPDLVLILPWNIKDEIMEQMAGIRRWGGCFAVPIPEPAVIP